MTFESILFTGQDAPAPADATDVPAFFGDLNLDQIVSAVVAECKDYDLRPFFQTRLHDLDAIAYRQEVMHDLEAPALLAAVISFSGQLRAMRARLDQLKTIPYRYAYARSFVNAAGIYCDAVMQLSQDLGNAAVASRGWIAFRVALGRYVGSERFRTLYTDVTAVTRELSAIRYSLLIRDNAVTVRRHAGERDYSAAIEDTFAKFRRGTTTDYLVKFPEWGSVDHIQGQILDRLALLYPDQFRDLEAFFAAHNPYVDESIARFDREVQFYVAFLNYIRPLRNRGLPFCYPTLSDAEKAIDVRDGFDLAVASKLSREGRSVVPNDFWLRGQERIFVVSGPNQGGKTTFARMFGQLHYLASLGCAVPGSHAQLFLFDEMYVHFEREEDINTLRGKLQDDLVRIHDILVRVTPNSIVILNEIFSSTAFQDALTLGRRIMAQLSARDLLCVCVTFLDALASFDGKTVSVVSTVVPGNPAVRTFRLERRPADGLAYALAIAEKHRVTYERLRERLQA